GESFGIAQSVIPIEFTIRIDGEMLSRSNDSEHRFQAAKIFVKGQTAHFHLHHCIAGVEMTPHFLLKIPNCLPWPVPAAADIAEQPLRNLARCEPAPPEKRQRVYRRFGQRHPIAPPRWCQWLSSAPNVRPLFPAASCT